MYLYMKFSIIVPAYKPDFLKDCIDSILNQTYPDFELIIVNDASPYDLDTIIDAYQDNRIRYYKNEKNFGAVEMVKNWNHCLEFAQGDFVINMGDDDKLFPNCLENYIHLIEKYPNLDCYHTRTMLINELSECIEMQEGRPETESVYAMIWYFWKGRRQMIGDWLFRTESLRSKGGYYDLPCAWGADDLSAFRMAAEKGVANTRTFGFAYRENQATVSKSSQFSIPKADAWLEIKKWYIKFLEKSPEDEIDKYYHQFICKRLNSYIQGHILYEINKSMKENTSNLCFWLQHCNKYNIKRRTLYSLARRSYKEKIKNLFK